MFWGLDAYYLRQERLFRKLYDKVRRDPDPEDPFTMNTAPFARDVQPWDRTLFSFSIFYFHASVVAALALGLWHFLSSRTMTP